MRGAAMFEMSDLANGRLSPRRGFAEVDGTPFELIVTRSGSVLHIVTQEAFEAPHGESEHDGRAICSD